MKKVAGLMSLLPRGEGSWVRLRSLGTAVVSEGLVTFVGLAFLGREKWSDSKL